MDQDQETLIKLRGHGFKSYVEKFLPPMIFAKQHLGNLITNVRTFLARDFHMKSGMKYLIESFYRSIIQGTPVPIPYREILLTAKIMDAIFEQLRVSRSQSGTSRLRFLDPVALRKRSTGANKSFLHPVDFPKEGGS